MDKQIIFGTSFSPEYASQVAKGSDIKPIEVLDTIHKKLGISDIRFGIRWNKVDDGKKFDLGFYREYLDYLFRNNCKVTLNLGPIKVFRWPEEHIPAEMHKYAEDVVTEDSELAKNSYEYLEKILTKLKNEYGENIQGASFQLDNEPLYSFGKFGMLMSEGHIKKTASILKKHQPGAKLLFVSAGRRNLEQFVKLSKVLSRDYDFKGNDFTIGLTYYFKIAGRRFFKVRDPLIIASPSNMSIRKLHQEQKNLGFHLEISEGQFEPWGEMKTPGNSIEDFEYMVKKSVRYFPRDYENKLIRLWGTEHIALKLVLGRAEEVHLELACKIGEPIEPSI